ncbi:hypothetical protein C8J57DRAFT_1278681 [Mycena rebaudengoi]|nr:hypothetical protein C8J57DRAFT_1278681 [Mycena rebaudengoi]
MQHQAQNLSRKGSEPMEQQGTHANGMCRSDIRVSAPLRHDNPALADFGPPTSRCRIAYSYSLTPPYIPTSRTIRSFFPPSLYVPSTFLPLPHLAPSAHARQQPLSISSPKLYFQYARFDCGEHGPCTGTRRVPHEHPPHRARQRAYPRARREACFSPRRGLSRRSGEEQEITARPYCYLWRWTWTRRRLRVSQARRQRGSTSGCSASMGSTLDGLHHNTTITPTVCGLHRAIKFHRGRRMYYIFFTTVAQFRFSLQHFHCYVDFGTLAICLRSGLPSLTVRGLRVRIPVRSVDSVDLRLAAKFRY